MSNIPLARVAVSEALKLTDNPKIVQCLKVALSNMHRERPIRKVSPQAKHMDKHIAQQIRAYAARHPDEAMRTIGRRFDVDQGRVSEALNRKRL